MFSVARCKTYLMYHGTSSKNAQSILSSGRFKPSSGGILGPGVYLCGTLQKASRYPTGHPEQDRAVLRVLVKGYSTASLSPDCGTEESCVFDPRRIEIIDVIRPKSH
ncbi:hypothetical protein WMY93_002045 [Mugilogobius chulae]|uniref:PARP catalytic domain-containing protein n=1 Tax=Mugilogobius chulae TaxID=88201 RepID=A0AAW0PVN6_9GOBI